MGSFCALPLFFLLSAKIRTGIVDWQRSSSEGLTNQRFNAMFSCLAAKAIDVCQAHLHALPGSFLMRILSKDAKYSVCNETAMRTCSKRKLCQIDKFPLLPNNVTPPDLSTYGPWTSTHMTCAY